MAVRMLYSDCRRETLHAETPLPARSEMKQHLSSRDTLSAVKQKGGYALGVALEAMQGLKNQIYRHFLEFLGGNDTDRGRQSSALFWLCVKSKPGLLQDPTFLASTLASLSKGIPKTV